MSCDLFEVKNLPKQHTVVLGKIERCICEGVFHGSYPKHTIQYEDKIYMQCEVCEGIISCEGCGEPVETTLNCGRFCARHLDLGPGVTEDPLTISCTCCHECRSNCAASLIEDPPQAVDEKGNIIVD